MPLIEVAAPADEQGAMVADIMVKPVLAPAALTEAEPVTATGPMVLVAEDNPTNQWLIRQQPNKLGYRSDLRANGREALDAYRAGHHAMIITDYHMPEMDGLDLSRAIRDSESADGPRVPIVALTANALPGVVDRCREAGIDEVLTKPTKLSILASVLAQSIGPGATQETDTPEVSAPDLGDQVLDTTMITEIFGTINDEVRACFAHFLSGGADMTELIEFQARESDAAALAKTAHRLAGESLSAGAIVLGRLCKDMEKAATEADWDAVSALRPQIGTAFGSVREAIAAL